MTSFEDIKTTLYTPPSARGPKPMQREVPRWQVDMRLAEALRIITAPSIFVLQTVAIVLLLRWTWGGANHPSHAAVPAHAESVTPGRVEPHEPPRTPPVTLPAAPSQGPAAPQVPMIVPQVLAAPQVHAMPQVSVIESQMPFTPPVPVAAPQVLQMPESPASAPVGLIPASVGQGSATVVGSASHSPQSAVPAAGAIAEATPRVQVPSRKASGKRAAASLVDAAYQKHHALRR